MSAVVETNVNNSKIQSILGYRSIFYDRRKKMSVTFLITENFSYVHMKMLLESYLDTDFYQISHCCLLNFSQKPSVIFSKTF